MNRLGVPTRLIGVVLTVLAPGVSRAAPEAGKSMSPSEAMEHAVAHNPKVTGAAAARLVAQTTERTLVDRVRNGVLEQVPVRRGAMVGERVAVIGPLAPGDQVLKPGSEELRNNTHVSAKRPEAGAKH